MNIPGVTITCREIVEVMTDYLENKLEHGDRLRFERHLVQCPPCKDYLRQLRSTIAHVGGLRALETDVPDATREALLSAFRSFRRGGTGGSE